VTRGGGCAGAGSSIVGGDTRGRSWDTVWCAVFGEDRDLVAKEERGEEGGGEAVVKERLCRGRWERRRGDRNEGQGRL
jgi:hypothetical protein